MSSLPSFKLPLDQETPLQEKKNVTLTPVMSQYLQLKETYKDALLFFRLGDFYELFFEDAIIAAKELDIVLTKRGKNAGEDIAMCGVPAHAYESYLSRLIQKGYKVAICEQMEDPETAKKRGAKGPLKRDVVRVVTPGTLTEEALLNAKSYNFLLAFSPPAGKEVGVAIIDLSTGTFLLETTDILGIPSVLARLNPAEILLPDRLLLEPQLFDHFAPWKKMLTSLPQARFDKENSLKRLQEAYGVQTLDAFGNFSAPEIRAAGALLDYLQLTQKSSLKLLDRPRQVKANMVMTMDAATRRSLELHQTQSGQRHGALLDVIDRTVTAAGSRLLSLHLSTPLLNGPAIQERLDNVTFFYEAMDTTNHLREALSQCPDLERALSRLHFQRGSPRDLATISLCLSLGMYIKDEILGSQVLPVGLEKIRKKIGHHHNFIDKLSRALGPNLPVHAKDGGFIAPEYNEELDAYRHLCKNSQAELDALQNRYILETGINTLKIKHNNIIGYHIDIGPSHATKVPPSFIHRQTLASSLRFTTTELSDLAQKISGAEQQALSLELQIFQDLVDEIHLQLDDILACGRALASLDLFSSLAFLAREEGYTRPHLDDSSIFRVEGGFHPVVSYLLKKKGDSPFVSNSCLLDEEQKIILLTGPNMAGKSTYLRQNALIAILAQMGSYVPAQHVHMGLVDRIFSRVGAADDLATGRSTFMVEMVETATILHQATSRSFVILDEIGRGTATFDGLSIAWAVIEYIHAHNQCRTLFATHYHELTKLADQLSTLRCQTMRIKEWEDKVIFMHEVVPGQADKSYGIHVAALAGLPRPVLQRATQILQSLEADHNKITTIPEPSPYNLPVIQEERPVEKHLKTLNIDDLSPRQALEVLWQLQGMLSK